MNSLIRDSRCRCGSNARLVTYRRNGDDQAPTYVCAMCEGQQAKYFYETSTLFQMGAVKAERRPSADAEWPLLPRVPKGVDSCEPNPLKMKPRYTGPRAAHDPMR